MANFADIDIDFPSSFNPQHLFENAVQASMIKKNELVKHPCGMYFQNMAVDPITGLAAIPYEEAEVLGYFKIDFLHLTVLDSFKTKSEIRQLLKKEPNWDLLLNEQVVLQLFQLNKHTALLQQIKPRSIEELADTIALIRPGKRILLDSYLRDRKGTRPKLYRQTADDKSSFRKGHALAYALTIVLQLHAIEQKLS